MRRIRFTTVVCLAGLLGACSPAVSGKPGDGASFSVLQVPGLGLGPQDDIDAVDFAVDPLGTLHVVWRAVVKRPGSMAPEYSVFYVRGEKGGEAWGRPIEIAGSSGEPPRIAFTSSTIHVLFGPKLRHFSGDGHGPFREEAPLVAAGRQRAVAFAASGAGDDLLVAYLLDVPGPAPAESALELHLAGGAGGRPDAVVARFPGSVLRQADPRLVADGGRLHLLCALNGMGKSTVVSGGRTVEQSEPRGQLFYLRSIDGGATWTQPAEIAAAAPPPIVQAVDLVAHGGRLTALYSAFGLWAARSADGETWSAPVPVAPYSPSLSQGSSESGSVAAVAAADTGVLSWIDARFRESDRRWWNPLGGWPWSDADPLWANNDVFILSLPDLDAVLAGRPVNPRRLTPPLSFAYGLRARAAPGGRAVLVWAGRPKVGKRLDAFHQPPALFYMTLPPEPGPSRVAITSRRSTPPIQLVAG